MPYNSLQELPDQVRDNASQQCQRIFLEAYNSIEDNNSDLSESELFQRAWGSMQQYCSKNEDGTWTEDEEHQGNRTESNSPSLESVQSGVVALASQSRVDPFGKSGPYPVSGIAMPEDVVTRGASGVERLWPSDTLRAAADALKGKSIVTDFHPAEPRQAPGTTIIGQIHDAGYEDGVGLRFSGEVSDREMAKKIDRGYLEVSTRPAIGAEVYDESQDLRIVEAIDDWLDIAVVDQGAAAGNMIEMGSDPAVAALEHRLQVQTDADSDADTDIDAPESNSPTDELATASNSTLSAQKGIASLQEDGDDDESGGGGSSSDGGDDSGNEDTRLDTWATFIASISDINLDNANLNALYRLIAAEIDGVTPPDVGEVLPQDALDGSLTADDVKQRIGGLIGGDDNDTEANILNINSTDSGLTAALKHSVSLTGSTPDRCGSIKDGAKPIGALHDGIAHSVLPQQGNGEKVNIGDDGDHVSRQALGLEDTAEDKEREPEIIDIDRDPISRAALGLNTEDEDDLEPDPATKAYGERVRAAAEGEDFQDTDAKTTVDVGDDPITHHLLGIDESDEDDEPDPVTKSFGDRVRKTIAESKEPDRTDINDDALAGSAVSGDPVSLSVEIAGGDSDDSDD